MKKLSVIMMAAALIGLTDMAFAQTGDKKVQSQKDLKTKSAKQSQQIRTDQGVPFSASGVHGAGGTATTKDKKSNSSGKKQSNKTKKKPVGNAGMDSKAGHTDTK